jgi:uncharacterized protein
MTDVILKVYLRPKASKNEIAGPFKDGIKVKVSAPPVEGKANEALLRFLAKTWKIPLSQIEIIRGHHSREKTLRISGVREGSLTGTESTSEAFLPKGGSAQQVDFKKKMD